MTDFFIRLIELTLDTDLNGEKETNLKSLFIHNVFAVQTRKKWTSAWSKTAQGGNNGRDVVLFPVWRQKRKALKNSRKKQTNRRVKLTKKYYG